MTTKVTQAVVTTKTVDPNQITEKFALFDESGNQLEFPQDGGDITHTIRTTATAIGTAAKAVSGAAPTSGTIVALKFTNGNSADSPTVAFGGGAAKPILLGGTAVTGAKCAIAANGVALFLYDGTSLHQIGAYT